MRNVKLNKTELLDIVRKNKEKHVADYKFEVMRVGIQRWLASKR